MEAGTHLGEGKSGRVPGDNTKWMEGTGQDWGGGFNAGHRPSDVTDTVDFLRNFMTFAIRNLDNF